MLAAGSYLVRAMLFCKDLSNASIYSGVWRELTEIDMVDAAESVFHITKFRQMCEREENVWHGQQTGTVMKSRTLSYVRQLFISSRNLQSASNVRLQSHSPFGEWELRLPGPWDEEAELCPVHFIEELVLYYAWYTCRTVRSPETCMENRNLGNLVADRYACKWHLCLAWSHDLHEWHKWHADNNTHSMQGHTSAVLSFNTFDQPNNPIIIRGPLEYRFVLSFSVSHIFTNFWTLRHVWLKWNSGT
jgi:hypothetical protein